MGEIETRLEEITYQIIKGRTLSDDKKVVAVQSILDAAINLSTQIETPSLLPAQMFGVAVDWSTDGKTASFTLNDYKIENDNLTDNIIPGFSTSGNTPPTETFMTNGKYFQTNGKYFTITA